jgi:rubrerythrin
MKNFESAEEILDFAIKREQEAHDFYTQLAEKVENSELKKALQNFAREELGHKSKLESVKKGGCELNEVDAPSMGIADYTVERQISEDMDYQDILILAMKKEKKAYRLYLDLAERAMTGELTELFLELSRQEANHKLRFELEYDNEILKED